MRDIQKYLLNYLDDQSSSHFDFQNFSIFSEDLEDEERNDILNELLHIISEISCNHHRTANFFDKIEEILKHLSNEIKRTFSNYEIYNIFQKNYRVLLFLFKENIIQFDKIANLIHDDFFFYEKLSYLNQGPLKLNEFNEQSYKNYEKNRKNGENESYICSLIRNDSVEEFISYVNKNNISLTSKIHESIFETNCYLKYEMPTLIEYAAFFGAIQIFQYLQMNNVNLNSSLWIYAIHSNNPDLIHIIENNHIDPPNNSFEKCLEESIKCHHNEIANYIIDNYLNEKYDSFPICIQYYNFAFFQNNINDDNISLFIKYKYITIPKMFFSDKMQKIDKQIVLLRCLLYEIFI